VRTDRLSPEPAGRQCSHAVLRRRKLGAARCAEEKEPRFIKPGEESSATLHGVDAPLGSTEEGREEPTPEKRFVVGVKEDHPPVFPPPALSFCRRIGRETWIDGNEVGVAIARAVTAASAFDVPPS